MILRRGDVSAWYGQEQINQGSQATPFPMSSKKLSFLFKCTISNPLVDLARTITKHLLGALLNFMETLKIILHKLLVYILLVALNIRKL